MQKLNVVNGKTLVYGFCYSDSVMSEGTRVKSLHITKYGAYKAMNAFINKKYMDWYNNRIMYGKFDSLFSSARSFHFDKHWSVCEIELEN